jgi:hypothetical protein
MELRIRRKLHKAFSQWLFDTSFVGHVNPSNNMCFRYVGTLEDLYAGAQVLHGKVLCRSWPQAHCSVNCAAAHSYVYNKKYRIRGPDW